MSLPEPTKPTSARDQNSKFPTVNSQLAIDRKHDRSGGWGVDTRVGGMGKEVGGRKKEGKTNTMKPGVEKKTVVLRGRQPLEGRRVGAGGGERERRGRGGGGGGR